MKKNQSTFNIHLLSNFIQNFKHSHSFNMKKKLNAGKSNTKRADLQVTTNIYVEIMYCLFHTNSKLN